jgi:hypothetical protein
MLIWIKSLAELKKTKKIKQLLLEIKSDRFNKKGSFWLTAIAI